ncbi:Flavohemoprotein [Pseudovibrio axinellae]|uniref:Flavohemoprotein n=1 Tax=Pseudovibrio axinellae TaxID=989403 RepID=A0A161V882_9HYPH|nr:ferric reductase-like transmembrane domain-containing protein [Pseudovibrio axinellae]KZL15378.1 Flavohemoprotein [Pseudovibrio axinellae]SER53931.1 Predicted ferric reductase [Pseudovibrio axinellae]
MTTIRISLWSLLAGLTVLWFSQSAAYPESFSVFPIRTALTSYTGILAMGAMSVAMILATRSKWFEGWLNGMDKSYRLHKWLGITALSVSVSHWLIVTLPKWMVDWGVLEAPDRSRVPPGISEQSVQSALEVIQETLLNQRGLAEFVGEYAFYIALVLMVLALVKNFPYKRFLQTHTVLGVCYLVLVFHSIVLFPFDLWLHPLGVVMAALLVGGTVSAVLILTRRHGQSNRTKGKITALTYQPSMKTLSVSVKVDKDWKGHDAGQFAFVSFDKEEGQHPYTIASHWNADNQSIRLLIKELGDYTSALPHKLKEGGEVEIEGPYGNFTFGDSKSRQIWVSAGVGITPFMARMKQLAVTGSSQIIDLFHVTSAITPEMEEELRADAKAANIDLHLIIDSNGTGFSAEKLKHLVPEWKQGSLWFCGPHQMGRTLKTHLTEGGLRADSFHQELFEMR